MEEALVDEFFDSTTHPATTHQEWLLRRCTELMEREATVVSLLEEEYRNGGEQTGGECRKSSRRTRE